MNSVYLTAFFLLLAIVILHFLKPQEPFSLELKTSLDGKMIKSVHGGAFSVMDGITSQAKKMTYAVTSVLPFKDRLRKWNRNLRRRNM